MKKLLAVVMTLVMVVAFCVPSSASIIDDLVGAVQGALSDILGDDFEMPNLEDIGDQIVGVLDGLLSGLLPGGGEGEGEGDGETPSLPDISETTISPELAKAVVNAMLRQGYSKEDIQAAFDQLHEEGQLNDESYENLTAALAEAEVPEITVPDSQVGEAAQRVIEALRKAGVSDDQMQSVVDSLHDRGVIPDNVYEEITNILNSQEETTEAETSGGIGGLFDKIKDFFSGLFGGSKGDGDGDEGDNANTPSGGSNNNPTGFGAKEPTGDTAVTSVAAVAAVAAIAGAALLLTKKKKEQ